MERHLQKVIVADASVIVKWFVEGDYTMGRIDIWSTQLIPFEVLNVLRYNQEL